MERTLGIIKPNATKKNARLAGSRTYAEPSSSTGTVPP